MDSVWVLHVLHHGFQHELVDPDLAHHACHSCVKQKWYILPEKLEDQNAGHDCDVEKEQQYEYALAT
jgi:hypothetical protein